MDMGEYLSLIGGVATTVLLYCLLLVRMLNSHFQHLHARFDALIEKMDATIESFKVPSTIDVSKYALVHDHFSSELNYITMGLRGLQIDDLHNDEREEHSTYCWINTFVVPVRDA